ncbi:DUF4430 domain-containing protein [Candidatus Bathyarchaeota archaeon]|nr:DUF4430 domain-containing protein [Candidatus Bathyarchaeota archaeon]
MSERTGAKGLWMWISLGLVCLLIISIYVAAYYYNESERYKRLYERAAEDLKRLLMPVNILIDYGNGTAKWYNGTLVQRESTLFEAIRRVAKVEYITGQYGVFVTHINGVGGDPNRYWIWYLWNPTTKEWTWGPVACDAYVLHEEEIVAWRYEQF